MNHVSFKEPPRPHGYGMNSPNPGREVVGLRQLPQVRQLPKLDQLGSMSQAEKSHAKMCLQEEIKAFTERALYGENCEVVNAASGQVALARYAIDSNLAEITITPTDSRIPPVTGQLQRLRYVADKRRVLDDSEAHITPAARARLTEDLISRLAALEFDVESETHALAVLVLLPSSIERDHFVMCLNVLRHFAQQAPQSALPHNK